MNTTDVTAGSPRPARFLGPETVREIAVVVTSILIAFGLDAWWDGVSDRHRLRGQLQGVVLELEAGRAQLQEAVVAHELMGGAAADLRRRVENGGSSARVAVPDTLVGVLFSHFVMDIATSATNDFVDGGGLALMDPDVAARLRDWPAEMADAIDDQAQLRSGVQSVYLPYMLAAGDLGNAVRAGSDMVGRAYATVRGVPVRPFRSPPRDVEITRTPELLNLLAWRVSNEETRRRQMESLLAAQNALIAELGAVLGD